MVDFTDGIDFLATDPFTRTIRQSEAKLKKDEEGYPSRQLLSWCQERGGLHLFSFRGDQPRIAVPSSSECPAIFIVGSDGAEDFEMPYSAPGAREIPYTLTYTGWIYTDDQEEVNQFFWLFLGAITKPWLKNDFDELYGPNTLPEVVTYWPSSPPRFTPWCTREDIPPDVWMWEQEITFSLMLELFR